MKERKFKHHNRDLRINCSHLIYLLRTSIVRICPTQSNHTQNTERQKKELLINNGKLDKYTLIFGNIWFVYAGCFAPSLSPHTLYFLPFTNKRWTVWLIVIFDAFLYFLHCGHRSSCRWYKNTTIQTNFNSKHSYARARAVAITAKCTFIMWYTWIKRKGTPRKIGWCYD